NSLRVLKMVLGDGCAEFNLSRSPAERVRDQVGVNQIRVLRQVSDDRASQRNQKQCEEEDSNLHSFRNQILSLARLPVPPSSRAAWAIFTALRPRRTPRRRGRQKA